MISWALMKRLMIENPDMPRLKTPAEHDCDMCGLKIGDLPAFNRDVFGRAPTFVHQACLFATEKTVDMVNHPPHYTRGKIEVIDFIEDQGLDFHRAQVVKYVVRAGHKDPTATVQDLRKALWYLDRLIANTEGRPGK
jgi:hypothetical protein